MELTDLLRSILALLFVLALILALGHLVRRQGWGAGLGTAHGADRRMSLQESLMLDARHRLLLVRVDDRDHLLVAGPQGVQPIAPPPPSPFPQDLRPQGMSGTATPRLPATAVQAIPPHHGTVRTATGEPQ